MTGSNPELMDGYRVLWLQHESRAEIEKGLKDGEFDGIGLNPYRGWMGRFRDVVNLALAPKALVVPFGDRVEFDSALLSKWHEIEMILLAEFSGIIRFDSDKLKVVRVLINRGMSFGNMPSLRTLYLEAASEATLLDLQRKAVALEILQINGGKLFDISAIRAFSSLKALDLTNVKMLKYIAPIEHLTCLECLTIESVKGITDLVPTLRKLRALKVLRIIDCSEIENLSFLRSLSLQEFRCSRTKIKNRQEEALKRIPTVFVG